jgi:DNA-binding helix-hairpin-helix protein with protein kinase domain
MGNLIPESLVWLDQIENLKGKTRKEWRAELKKVHDLSSSQITNLLSVKVCFDQTAFDKVRQAEKANPSFTLSLNSAMALAGLKGKVSDLSSAIHAALDVTLARRLTTKKIKNLVKWIISGKPASDFDPNKKTTGTQEEKTEEDASEDQTGTEPTGKTRTWTSKSCVNCWKKPKRKGFGVTKLPPRKNWKTIFKR